MNEELPKPNIDSNTAPLNTSTTQSGQSGASPSNKALATDNPQPQQFPKKSRSKISRIIIGLALVIIVLGGLAYLRHHNQATNPKKDIPYLTYGYIGSGDIPEIYPLEPGDDANTIFDDSQLFEGLVGYKNEINLVPLLATSWYNPSDTTWVFNLRHNVTFHSGRTMTATDVAYSLNYDIAHDMSNGGDTALAFASAIDKVTIIDPYKIEIITNQPDAVLLNQLDYLYIIDSKDKPGDPNAGTGPYTVKGGAISPNADTLNLLAYNKYWGGHVYTKQVLIKEYASAGAMAKDAANGLLDLSGDYDTQQLAEIKTKIKHYQTIDIPDLGVSYLNLNTEKPSSPLYLLAARQAVQYALNIPAILKAGGISGTQASQLIPPSIPGHDPSISNVSYNPAKAKQLLAGVPNASAAITLFFPAGDEGQVAEIAKEMNAVGFNVKTSGIADLNNLFAMQIAGQGDIFYSAYGSSTLDGLDIINNTVAGTQNFTSSQMTDLINQTNVAFNPSSRTADLQKIEKLIAAQIPAVPLYTQDRVNVLTKPYVLNNSLPDVLTNTYFWQVYQR